MNLLKIFGKNKNKALNIIIVVGVLFIVGLLMNYSGRKGLAMRAMTTRPAAPPAQEMSQQKMPQMNDPAPAQQTGIMGYSDPNVMYASVNEMGMSPAGSEMSRNVDSVDPSELLPPSQDTASWNGNAPVNDLEMIAAMDPMDMNGLNTVGTSRKNANLQLRDEPIIPKEDTYWNKSTIEPDDKKGYYSAAM